jgi:hypothetical protein
MCDPSLELPWRPYQGPPKDSGAYLLAVQHGRETHYIVAEYFHDPSGETGAEPGWYHYVPALAEAAPESALQRVTGEIMDYTEFMCPNYWGASA